MTFLLRMMLAMACFISSYDGYAQGPPVWMDKPIMLGSGKGILRLMNLSRVQPNVQFNAIILSADYNVLSNLELGINQAFITNWKYESVTQQMRLGDMNLGAKYQFYRKDMMAKTFRVAGKLTESLPFGPKLSSPIIGWGTNTTTVEAIAAYESLKLGAGGQIGYLVQHRAGGHRMATAKLGIGLPLLPAVYPVRQFNMYLDSEWMLMTSEKGAGWYLAQASQFAWRTYLFEAGIQWPLYQSLPENLKQNVTVMAGARMVF